jgi:hypothetical protein
MLRTISAPLMAPCWIRMLRTMVRMRRWKFIGWCGELIPVWGQMGGRSIQVVPAVRLSTAGVLWVSGACRLWGQSKEGGGTPDDEMVATPPANFFLRKKYKERGRKLPPLLYFRIRL